MIVNALPKITGALCVVLLHVGLLWLLNEARTGRPAPVTSGDHRVAATVHTDGTKLMQRPAAWPVQPRV